MVVVLVEVEEVGGGGGRGFWWWWWSWWRLSYKELQGKSEQQQTYWSLQGCSVLNLMYKYNTIYQSSPTIKRKLYGSK